MDSPLKEFTGASWEAYKAALAACAALLKADREGRSPKRVKIKLRRPTKKAPLKITISKIRRMASSLRKAPN